jgi:hypothetical protein
LQDPPKFTQIWIFGLKTNHLATLNRGPRCIHLDRQTDIFFAAGKNIEILKLERGPANILGERTPCKKSAVLQPRQGNLGTSKEHFFSGLQNLPLTSQNRREISSKKLSLFQTCFF